MSRLHARLFLFTTCSTLLVGCSNRPASIDVPDVDPDSVAKAAIDAWDSSGDGQLSQEEAAKCPGLLHAFKRYDKDNDKLVSADEIATRIGQLFGADIGMFTLGCTVTLDGRPLPQAEVKLVPEPCFGDAIKPAGGTTRDNGRAMFTIAPEDLPEGLQGVRGVNAGLYRIEITHPNIDLPAKYNAQTTLGREVSQDDQINGLRLELQSK